MPAKKPTTKRPNKRRTILLVVIGVALLPFVIAVVFHFWVLNVENRTVAEVKDTVLAMGLSDPVREDYSKGCSERYSGFSIVGYGCSYTTYQYYPGPPNEEVIIKSLEKQGFEIHRISKEPGFFELQALKSGHLTVNIHYRKEFIADSGDKSTYPPTLWREHVYQVYVGNQKTVL